MSAYPLPVDRDPEELRARIAQVPYWRYRLELAPGVVTPGVWNPDDLLRQMEIPERLDGLRALDIGTNDGFFAFELARRGAAVTAVEPGPPTAGFALTQELTGLDVDYVIDSVYELTPDRYGEFDLVLFLGVLYHLRHPLLALDVLSTLCRGRIWVESHVLDHGYVSNRQLVSLETPNELVAQFYPRDELNADASNWWAPTLAGMAAMVESSLFRIEDARLWSRERGVVRGRFDASLEPELYPGSTLLHDPSNYIPPAPSREAARWRRPNG